MSNWALPSSSWRCEFKSADGEDCGKTYKDRKSLRRHVNMVHELDLTPGDRPSLFRPDDEVIRKRLAMLRRNSANGKPKRSPPDRSEVKPAKKQKGRKNKVVDSDVPALGVPTAVADNGAPQSGADHPLSVQSLKDLDTPALLFSPLPPASNLLTPRTASNLIASLCGIADEVLEATQGVQSAAGGMHGEDGSGDSSSSSSSCSTCSSTSSSQQDKEVVETVVLSTSATFPPMSAVEKKDEVPLDEEEDVERSRDENAFLTEGYRVLRKHYAMIIPSRVEGPCKFCALARGTCNPCAERFVARLEARCGQGSSSFERYDRELAAKERKLLQSRVRPIKSPCGFCCLNQSMCAACWTRFGARELAD